MWGSLIKQAFKLISYVLRAKSNQPVQSADATLNILIAPVVRMVSVLLGYALSPIAHLDVLPGVRPDDLYKLAFGGVQTPGGADAAQWWHWMP